MALMSTWCLTHRPGHRTWSTCPMDTWIIIVVAVVLIAIFIPLLMRSMFSSSRGDGGSSGRTGQEPENFSDDPPASGRR